MACLPFPFLPLHPSLAGAFSFCCLIRLQPNIHAVGLLFATKKGCLGEGWASCWLFAEGRLALGKEGRSWVTRGRCRGMPLSYCSCVC